MSRNSWRDYAFEVIAEVIKETLPGRVRPFSKEEQAILRKALRHAYPFGERRHHPYKIWCSEVRKQLGSNLKPFSFSEEESK